jgi:hypothetical protein
MPGVHSSVAVGHLIFIVGLEAALCFNETSGEWKRLMLSGLYAVPALSVLDGCVFAAFGSTLGRYDPSKGEWATFGHFGQYRKHPFGLCAVNGMLAAVGGAEDFSGEYLKLSAETKAADAVGALDLTKWLALPSCRLSDKPVSAAAL